MENDFQALKPNDGCQAGFGATLGLYFLFYSPPAHLRKGMV